MDVTTTGDVELQSTSLRGSVLQWLAPGLMQAKAARDLSAQASHQLRSKLARGVTLTYDVWRSQADLALEQLAAGQTPVHPFPTEVPWVVNESVLLPPGATQAFGPFAAETVHQLDVVNRTGPGLKFRAVCASAMPANFEALRRGVADRLPSYVVIDRGAALQASRTLQLAAQRCPFYLVVFSADDELTVADIRVID